VEAHLHSLLAELAARGRQNDERETERSRKMLNLNPETARLVSLLVRSGRRSRLLEIGTSNGYSTIWLAWSVCALGGQLTSIEADASKLALADANLRRAGLREVVDLRHGDATAVVADLPGPFDLVFFDADRLSAPTQLALLLPKLTDDTLVLADNALSHPQDMAGFLAALHVLPEADRLIVPIGKGLSLAYLSDQNKARLHVFFGEQAVAKVPDVPKDTPIIPIRKAAVVGAGTMGGGIAMTYANAGIPVLLKEVGQEALDRGLATIRKNYASSVRKGRLTQQQMDERLARIQPTLSYDRFGEADIIVEAVFEGMALKKQVFAELDKAARPDAVLASNTSTLNIDEIAAATSRPRRVIGHHFFSPANVMRLLEIVRGQQTGLDVIATSLDLAKRLGKVGVLVGNCRGFVGNRMFHPYMREAQFLVEEGARIEEVDAALLNFGMSMGPLAVGDLAGLDVGWRIRKEYAHLEPPGRRSPQIADRLCERGHYGQKTGAGWYRYEAGSRTPLPNPEAAQLAEECARAAGSRPRSIAAEEIVERTLYALINEGARILEEGFALRAVDIDIIYINGYGFPAHRGGPMWYADTVGLKQVHDRMCQFEQHYGDLWTPDPLLKQLAAAGKTFADFDRARR